MIKTRTSIHRNTKQIAKSKDVTIRELFTMYKESDVKLSAQRYKESISKKSIKQFAIRVIDGLIHQNLTLANINQCFKNTEDSRWKDNLESKKPNLKFLILDGQHRMEMINTVMNNPRNFLETIEEIIEYQLQGTINKEFMKIKYNSNMLKTILNANKDMDEGKFKISNAGLMYFHIFIRWC